MDIRVATMSDKKEVLRLLDEFGSMLKAKVAPSEVGESIFDEIIGRKDTKIFVAEEEGRLIGVATFYVLPNIRHGWHRGHIEDFFVTAGEQGKGVGKKIFEFIQHFCKQNNIKVIKLDSGNELLQAHAFYEKLGGRTTERFFRFDIA